MIPTSCPTVLRLTPLSKCAAEWLDAHRAFNPAQPTVDRQPKIEMLPPSLAAPPNAIRLRFEVIDSDGLHQVQLLTQTLTGPAAGSPELLSCKALNGSTNTTVEFETTGLTPRNSSVSLQIIDINRNLFWSERYPIDVTSVLPRARVVSIPDANLAKAVRSEIGNTITTHALLNLTRLEAINREITDLTGLEHAYNLRSLNLGGEYIDGTGYVNSNVISDFSPLLGLTQLTTLNLSVNSLSDVSFLSELPQLKTLYFSNNNISDISPLSGLNQLTHLYLSNNSIADVSALSGLNQLTHLHLNDNALTDISPLSGLNQLTHLYLYSNNISDISPLSGLNQLTHLYLYSNNISDISPLSGLNQLTSLQLGNNELTDVSPLSGLNQLTHLELANNSISDVSPLVSLNLTGTEWDNTGLYLWNNPLNYASINTHIPAMQAKGIEVKFDNRTPTTFVKISGTAQQGIANTRLPFPFVVEVKDQHNRVFAGVPVTFAITEGGGHLSTTSTTTNLKGRAEAHLTLGRTPGTTTVRVTAAKISQPLQFTATATLPSTPIAMPDANLRAKVAATIGKGPEYAVTAADMLTLTLLTANNANIHDLTGLHYASNLKTLSLDNNNLSDVTPLTALTELERFHLTRIGFRM